MEQRILVTGSAGLIGRALVPALVMEGASVRRLDLAEQENARGDVRDAYDVRHALTDVDGVVHLAAISRVAWGERDPGLCWATNVGGVRTILEEAAQATRPPWLVFASSREVYGQPSSLPVHEDAPAKPMNVYGRTKAEGERLVDVAAANGLRACTIRLANVYGTTTDHADRVVPAFARAAAAGEDLHVEGAAHAFDFVHLDDVVSGLVTVARHLSAGHHPLPPIQLVTGAATTLGDLADMATRMAATGSQVHITKPRDFDVSAFVGDPRRARELLGWRARVPIDLGLERLITSFRAIQTRHETNRSLS